MAAGKNVKQRIYFYAPNLNQPSAGMGVLLKHATILANYGYQVTILYTPTPTAQHTPTGETLFEIFQPTWLEFSLDTLRFVALGQQIITTTHGKKLQCRSIRFRPDDLLVLPEGSVDVLSTLAANDCQKVVLAQSYSYIFPALPPKKTWADYDLTHCITLSEGISHFIHRYMPTVHTQRVHFSIDSTLFKPTIKQPKISYICRDDMTRLRLETAVKIFYTLYPNYEYFLFQELSGLPRNEFAQQLAISTFALFNDDIAALSMLPLEAMACHTHVIGWKTYGIEEYITPDNGFWVPGGDVMALGEKIGEVVDLYVKRQLDEQKLIDNYQKTLLPFTVQREESEVIEAYQTVMQTQNLSSSD